MPRTRAGLCIVMIVGARGCPAHAASARTSSGLSVPIRKTPDTGGDSSDGGVRSAGGGSDGGSSARGNAARYGAGASGEQNSRNEEGLADMPRSMSSTPRNDQETGR